uniref:Uncharacterized protein n=1 Tax=Arundo donax TaxID=35708 RepID=A0A0A9HDC4_ARUDO
MIYCCFCNSFQKKCCFCNSNYVVVSLLICWYVAISEADLKNQVLLYARHQETNVVFSRTYTPEWNFRLIIKKHMLTLLHYKNLYWKKEVHSELCKIWR